MEILAWFVGGIGALLVIAGIAWCYTVMLRKGGHGRADARREATTNPIAVIAEKITELIEAIIKKMASEYMPGVLMMVLGVVLVGASFAIASSNEGKGEPTPSTPGLSSAAVSPSA
jgi:hypothetical protein